MVTEVKVVERFVSAKTGRMEDCADALVETASFLGVIDGATPKTDWMLQGRNLAQVAAQVLHKTVRRMDPFIDAQTAVQKMTDAFASYYRTHGVDRMIGRHPNRRLAASVALLSIARKEVWLVGDCQCLVGAKLFRKQMKVEQVLSNARALFLQTELAMGNTAEQLMRRDTGREFILPLLKRQVAFENAPSGRYRYPVINGLAVPLGAPIVVQVPRGQQEIVIATDGYPRVCTTLAESEAYLARVLRLDPLCMRIHKATKGLREGECSFDDRAYLRVRV